MLENSLVLRVNNLCEISLVPVYYKYVAKVVVFILKKFLNIKKSLKEDSTELSNIVDENWDNVFNIYKTVFFAGVAVVGWFEYIKGVNKNKKYIEQVNFKSDILRELNNIVDSGNYTEPVKKTIRRNLDDIVKGGSSELKRIFSGSDVKKLMYFGTGLEKDPIKGMKEFEISKLVSGLKDPSLIRNVVKMEIKNEK
jgi:hypothetical protein